NGFGVPGQKAGFSADLIAAGGKQQRADHGDDRDELHIVSRAMSAAVSAASRRLSAASQIQTALPSFLSGVMAPTEIPLCPAMPALSGGSTSLLRTSIQSPLSVCSSDMTSGASSN